MTRPLRTEACDEILDGEGRLLRPWRRMLGTILGLGMEALRERATELNRALTEEGAGAARAGPWRCDPIPFLLPEAEFQRLAEGLVQRARLLDTVLRDVYGPRLALSEGVLPPALVFPNPAYLRPCRIDPPPGPQLHLYAADLARGPDGVWRVVADHTGAPAGLASVIENRRLMARALPEPFRAVEVAPIRPFVEAWADALARLTPGGTGIALLSPGAADAGWFGHVVLARALGCALVEDGDLTVRDGALCVKTLRGLRPVHVLLRCQEDGDLDPLELRDGERDGVPGLMEAMRGGAVRIVNAPGSGFAQTPALPSRLPALCRLLLGEELRLAQAEVAWGGDGELPEGPGWVRIAALDRAGPLKALEDAPPWSVVAKQVIAPSLAPCLGSGDVLEPRGAVLRLFLLWDGGAWRTLKGGVAYIAGDGPAAASPGASAMTGKAGDDDAAPAREGLRHAPARPSARMEITKDIWVLEDEGADIVGPASLPVPALAIRRMPADLPSRVADNFFWFGRYLERLETAARLSRAVLARLTRGGLLPRDVPDLHALAASMRDTRITGPDFVIQAGAANMMDLLFRAMSRDGEAVDWLTGRVQRLGDTLRDRLSAEMHAALAQGGRGLKGARLALRTGRGKPPNAGLLADFAGRILEFSATISGLAAENMVLGGGRMFLDLGRRIERGQAIAVQLAHALDQPPDRIEAGLSLGLELCDSTLTYRTRYSWVVQPAPVLDLLLEDVGNPRALGFQLCSARSALVSLTGSEKAKLPATLDPAIAETRRIVAELVEAADPLEAASRLPGRLHDICKDLARTSEALARQYFSLLPVQWAEALDETS